MRTSLAAILALALITGARGAPVVDNDSIPCVIITDQNMLSVFEDYAIRKAKRGSNTEVITLSEINAQYVGDTEPDRIREFVRDRYNNKHTEFLLIGGDVDVIPGMHVDWGRYPVLTDMYYTCLNGTWDHDGDGLLAEPPMEGDSLDFVRSVAVGRIPCSDALEAEAVIGKIVSYEDNDTHAGYRTGVLMTASWLFNDNDGHEINQRAAAVLPPGFSVEHFFQEFEPPNVWAAMNEGHGIILNNSHAQWDQSFLTYYVEGPPSHSTRQSIIMQDIDTLVNTDRYGVFFNYACYNNTLDSPDALGRHYMLNPYGGGAGYVGSTHMEFSKRREDFHLELFHELFGGGEVRIGKALLNAKDVVVPPYFYSWGSRWMMFFATMYLGDPQMEVWTAEPLSLSLSHPPALSPGLQTLSVTVLAGVDPVDAALVCIYKDDDVYVLQYTDSEGVAAFDDVDFSSSGSVSIVATKHDYFSDQGLLTISSSCCDQRVGDANGVGGDEPTVGDLNALIDAKFISCQCDGIIMCLGEADVNLSGGADPSCSDITIGDISALQDYLFGGGTLSDCF